MFLASYGFSGGGIGETLNKLESLGFFDYVLPFLLIFALVFGILSSTKIFRDNRAVDGIIALVVALMALQFDLVPQFFSQVFPRLGVALAGILVLLILAGFFIDPGKAWIMYVLLGIGAIASVAVLVNAGKATGFYYMWNFNENTAIVGGMLIFVIVIVLILAGLMKPNPNATYEVNTPFRR